MIDSPSILIITYYWPPAGGPGVQRMLKTAKYLPSFGYRPIILTVENGEYPNTDDTLFSEIPSSALVIKTPIFEPYRFYKKFTGRKKEDKLGVAFIKDKHTTVPNWKEKLATWIRGNFFIPDARTYWKKPGIRSGLEIIKKHNIKAIITSGPPHTAHLIGLALKEKSKLLWIADFRDPWTEMDYFQLMNLSSYAEKKHRRLEKEVLISADAVITVTPTMTKKFVEKSGRKVYTITNGFDEDDIPKVIPSVSYEKIIIGYIGNMYPAPNWTQIGELFSSWIKLFPELQDKLLLQFAGNIDAESMDVFKQFGLEKNIQILGYVSHHEAVKLMFSCHALLLVINQVPGNEQVLTGKIFEYISTGRPIIFSGPIPGDAHQLLSVTGQMIDVSRLPKVHPSEIQKSERLFSENNQFTRKYLTGKFIEIIENIHLEDED